MDEKERLYTHSAVCSAREQAHQQGREEVLAELRKLLGVLDKDDVRTIAYDVIADHEQHYHD